MSLDGTRLRMLSISNLCVPADLNGLSSLSFHSPFFKNLSNLYKVSFSALTVSSSFILLRVALISLSCNFCKDLLLLSNNNTSFKLALFKVSIASSLAFSIASLYSCHVALSILLCSCVSNIGRISYTLCEYVIWSSLATIRSITALTSSVKTGRSVPFSSLYNLFNSVIDLYTFRTKLPNLVNTSCNSTLGAAFSSIK